MNTIFKNNSEFDLFKDEIKKRLSSREIRKIEDDNLVPAAVMMLIFNKNNSPHALLTKRTQKVKHHKGQVSFPGGVFDEDDVEILNAAYRETFEEVGIPKDKIELLGQFDDYVSPAGFKVSCFVGSFGYPLEYKISEDEIEDCIEAPMSIFVNLEFDRTEDVIFRSKDYTMYFYSFQGFEIWGLTAKILTDFSQGILKNR